MIDNIQRVVLLGTGSLISENVPSLVRRVAARREALVEVRVRMPEHGGEELA